LLGFGKLEKHVGKVLPDPRFIVPWETLPHEGQPLFEGHQHIKLGLVEFGVLKYELYVEDQTVLLFELRQDEVGFVDFQGVVAKDVADVMLKQLQLLECERR
jgi:hypothetical protein